MSTKVLEFDLEAATEARKWLLHSIRGKPSTTLADLLQLLHGPWGELGRGLTMGELLKGEPLGTGGKHSRAKTATKVSRVVAAPNHDDSAFDTRTPEGRKRYDDAVVKLLRGSQAPLSAGQIRAGVGGTAAQTKAALNRLLATRNLTYSQSGKTAVFSLP